MSALIPDATALVRAFQLKIPLWVIHSVNTVTEPVRGRIALKRLECPMSDDNCTDDDETLAEEVLVEAIENQLAADDPPATRAVMNRLTLVGYPREEILQLMAQVLAAEIHSLMREQRAFDRDGYEAALRRLPELPDDPSNA